MDGTATVVDDAFTHPALFYRGEAAYLDGTIPFILDGLVAGEPVAVAVPGPNLRLLSASLGPAADRVLMLDMSDAGRNPGRILADVLHAAADPHPDRHTRIIGEPIWPGRSAVEYPACVQHEALINLAFRGRRATILCPYDAARLDAHVLADAAETHPVLLEDGALRTSSAYSPGRAIARMNTALPQPPVTPFRFDAPLLATTRRIAADAALRAGLPQDRIDDFVLGIGELTANSIRYGGGHGTLCVWVEDGMLAGEVHDSGRLEDPLAGRRRVPHTSLGGRGLWVVHHIADLVRTHVGPDGTTTRIYLRLPQEPAPPR
jgi:anti-sigma regulatory factor (Ser/Thr protein kinase)